MPLLFSLYCIVVGKPRSCALPTQRFLKKMSSALRDYASTDVCPKCEYAVEKFVKVEALDHVWHKWCLKCSICEEPLSPNDNCHMRELPNLLCKTHFDDPTAVVEAAENESGGSDVTDMITYSAGTKLVSNSERFEVGTAETAGTRPYMEDAMVVAGCFDGDPEKDFFAVYDGHGGSEAAGYACSHLHHFLKTNLKEHEPVTICFEPLRMSLWGKKCLGRRMFDVCACVRMHVRCLTWRRRKV